MARDGAIRVLLVEDDDGDALLVETYAAEVGSVVLDRARSLEEALTLLPGSFDAALIDLGLPDSQGLATVRAVCTHIRAAARPPIVVLTGLDDDAVALEAIRTCCQDYLVKRNINADNLLRSLRCAVERHGRDAVERQLTMNPYRGGDALAILRRVNQTLSRLLDR